MGTIRIDFLLFAFFFLAGFAHQLLYVLFPLFAANGLLRHHLQFRKNEVTNLFFIFFLFASSLYIFQSAYYHSFDMFALKGVFRYLAYACLAVFLTFFSAGQLAWVVEKVIQVFMLMLPYAIVETLVKDRYVFVFHHSNNLAYVLVLLLLFNLQSRFRWKWWYYLGLAFSILLTKSSGGTLVMVLLTALHVFFFENIPLKRKLYTSIALFSAIALVFSLFPERLVEQWDAFSGIDWEMIVYRAHKHWFGSHGSGVWRVTYWIGILDAFWNSPAPIVWLGLGLDAMTFGNYAYSFMNIDPHNDYVKLFTECGILGLLFFGWFVWAVSRIVKSQILWLVALLVPMYFGNILVNFPYMVLYVTMLTFLVKSSQTPPCEAVC